MAKREIFVGDIQGCFDEWMELLDTIEYSPELDDLYLCGDVINRGPKNLEVMQFLLDHPQIKCVMGNHEYYYWKNKKKKKGFDELDRQFGNKKSVVLDYISKLPLFIETDQWILVHAGMLPQGLHETPKELLITIRTLKDGRPWHHAYTGHKMVIYGHWALQGLTQIGKTWGLDSGCVYGGKLSALLLPEQKIVSVPAKRVYHKV